MRAVLNPPAPRPARAELGADPRDIEERLSPRPCSSSATPATAKVFINPAHVAMVEPSTVGDDNVTDVVVAAQDGFALVRVRKPIKDVVDNCSATPCGPRASTRSTSTTTSPPAYATTGRDSTAACVPCARATCSSSGCSTASAETSPTWSTPVQDLSARGVGLRVLAGQGAQIDTTTAAGRLVFGIFAALAEFERELIRERTQAGLKVARARGREGGRKFARSKAQVRLAQAAMAHRDTSVSEICRELGIRPVTLYRYVGPQGQLREQGEKILAA